MPSHNTRADVTLRVDKRTAAFLYNFLCDSQQTWAEDLIRQLRQQVTTTEAYNAKLALIDRGRRS